MINRSLPFEVVIGIPTYNRAAALDRAVRSALAQRHDSVSVLISDDASTDSTPDLCRALAASDSRVIVHRHECNLGLTANYNWVMKEALSHRPLRGGFFMFLPDDDWIEPNYVGLCVQTLHGRPGHSMVAGRTRAHRAGQASWFDPDVNLDFDDPIRRVATFCREVVPTGLMSGVMPFDVVAQLSPQRNAVGNDWLLLITVAFIGKIATLPETTIHRSADGASSSLRKLPAVLGVSALQAKKPLLTVGIFLVAECLFRSPVFAALPILLRVRVLATALAGLLIRRLPEVRLGGIRLVPGGKAR